MITFTTYLPLHLLLNGLPGWVPGLDIVLRSCILVPIAHSPGAAAAAAAPATTDGRASAASWLPLCSLLSFTVSLVWLKYAIFPSTRALCSCGNSAFLAWREASQRSSFTYMLVCFTFGEFQRVCCPSSNLVKHVITVRRLLGDASQFCELTSTVSRPVPSCLEAAAELYAEFLPRSR